MLYGGLSIQWLNEGLTDYLSTRAYIEYHGVDSHVFDSEKLLMTSAGMVFYALANQGEIFRYCFLNGMRQQEHAKVFGYLTEISLVEYLIHTILPRCGITETQLFKAHANGDMPFLIRSLSASRIKTMELYEIYERSEENTIDDKYAAAGKHLIFGRMCLEAEDECGFTASTIKKYRGNNPKTGKLYHIGTIYREIKILEDLGILVKLPKIKGRPQRWRFSDMMKAPETPGLTEGKRLSYTKSMIAAICNIHYQVGKRGEDRPLHRGSIPREPQNKMPVVKELIKMRILNELNKRLTPAIPEGKILWHIIEQGVVADSQRSSFAQQVNNASIKSDAPERIWILRNGDSLEQAIASIKGICPNAIFDVALASGDHIDRVPREEGIKMLVFEGSAGDFRQLQGVIAALRALRLEKEQVIPTLLRIYSILKGSSYEGEVPPPELLDEPREFARRFIFDLPPIKVAGYNELTDLNERLFQILTAA